MAALTGFREVDARGDSAAPDYYPAFNVAAAITIYGGSLVFVNASGQAVVASPDQTMTCVGYNDGSDIDNSAGAAGAKTITPRRGVIDLANNGSSIAADDVGKACYAIDNQTVDLDSGSSTRALVGTIEGVRADGRVYVNVGCAFGRALQTLEAVQPIDADLTALAALATTGLAARTGAGTWATRTITAPPAGISVNNGDGVAGNPTLSLADDLAALESLDGTAGLLAKTGADAYSRRTLTAGSAAVSVTNGNGQAGDPTIDNLFVPITVADPGDAAPIPVTRSAIIPITTGAGGETNTLAIPSFLGQRLIITHDVDGGGNRVITAASAINVAGNTIMTFADARDTVELVGIQLAGVLAWEVAWNNGVALS